MKTKETELVRKKNLKAKKGKQKWRKNVDVSELQTAIAISDKTSLQPKPTQNVQKQKPRFFIDAEPNKIIKQSLDPDRFKKKHRGVVSKLEQKIIKKKLNSALLKENKGNASGEEEIDETKIWGENQRKQALKKGPEETILKNPLPEPGQSYNPSFKDHKALLQDVVVSELSKNDIKHATSNKLKKKDRLNARKEEAPQTEKSMNHQFTLIKKYQKELKSDDKKREERRQAKEKRAQLEKELLKQGKVLQHKRIGKMRYQEKLPDFKLSSELPENLRKLNAEGNVARDAFEKIFRKGLVEPGNPFGAKKRIRKLPKYKFHRGRDDPDERILGERMNIYDY